MSTVAGLIVGAVGGIVFTSEAIYAEGRGTTSTNFGVPIVVLGAVLFVIGILVEFFEIGTAVRKIAEAQGKIEGPKKEDTMRTVQTLLND